MKDLQNKSKEWLRGYYAGLAKAQSVAMEEFSDHACQETLPYHKALTGRLARESATVASYHESKTHGRSVKQVPDQEYPDHE